MSELIHICWFKSTSGVKLDNGQPLVTLTLFELRLSVDAAVSMETALLRNAAAAAAATVRYGCPTSANQRYRRARKQTRLGKCQTRLIAILFSTHWLSFSSISVQCFKVCLISASAHYIEKIRRYVLYLCTWWKYLGELLMDGTAKNNVTNLMLEFKRFHIKTSLQILLHLDNSQNCKFPTTTVSYEWRKNCRPY